MVAALPMKQKCPTCGKVVEISPEEKAARTEFFPFCSKRCRLVDLGAWLDGHYRMTAELSCEDTEQV